MYSNRLQSYGRVPRPPAVTASPELPLGDFVETVARSSLDESHQAGRVGISDTKLIASYNWVADSRPKIMVPGKPPKWTPPTQPAKLKWDAGTYYRDVNAASYPDHPMEPAVVSIMKMNPEPIPVNIVACGNTIGNLLRFSRGPEEDKPFRMLVEVIGDTVHFIRREKSPKEVIPDVKGFGHTFPEAYTTWDGETRRSVSHQRILAYRFGGLDMMVRFEGDGFIQSPSMQRKEPTASSSTGNDNALPDLSALGMTMPVPVPSTGEPKLEVVDGGQLIPQDAVFDLKTRSMRARDVDTLGSQLHRLWVSQIEQFILAYHERGIFNDIQVNRVDGKVKEWEELNQPTLKRLAALLHLIVDRARGAADGKLEIVCSRGDELEIRRQGPGAGDVLSASVRAEWAEWLGDATSPASSLKGKKWDCPELRYDVDDEGYHDTFSDFSDSDGLKDLTACDRECGYCGYCSY
ncbi:hypothetical protein AK830_g11961 [Neonectria ditissima]|uniref:Geranylgeranyl pyrophosphate synthetase n=1 Tax=Neonectria ditissima TaxID=78410 RepID=A0A0P7ABQ4_9HYPO|nr:hypothetical protein AK830_g11961 [Neonectria ditissima]